MKFQVRRTTSGYYCEEQPCEGAFVYKRERGKLDDQDRLSWAIEVNSLEELLKVIEREDSSIIIHGPCEYQNGLPEIEIYNAYRE